MGRVIKNRGVVYAGRVGARMPLPAASKPNRPTKAKRIALEAIGGPWAGKKILYTQGSGEAVTLPMRLGGWEGQYRYGGRLAGELAANWVGNGGFKPSEGF